jgi:hypothetical protein
MRLRTAVDIHLDAGLALVGLEPMPFPRLDEHDVARGEMLDPVGQHNASLPLEDEVDFLVLMHSPRHDLAGTTEFDRSLVPDVRGGNEPAEDVAGARVGKLMEAAALHRISLGGSRLSRW